MRVTADRASACPCRAAGAVWRFSWPRFSWWWRRLHSPAAAGGPAISGIGSSYAALAIIQWDAEVASEFEDTVNYSDPVFGHRLERLRTLPAGGFRSERNRLQHRSGQFSRLRRASSTSTCPISPVPTCLDYNVTSTAGISHHQLETQLSASWSVSSPGQSRTWDDPAIQALNPGVLLPHNAIIVVFRSDASGDNFIFSDYLDTEQPALWNAFTSAVTAPAGAAAIWPQPPSGQRSLGQYNFGNWTSENGSDTASDYVYANPNTITYVETGYALLHHDPCAEVPTAAGPTSLRPSRRTPSPCRMTC